MPENTIIYPISVPLDQWPTYPPLEMKQATSGNIIHLTATSHGQPVTFPAGTTGEFRAHKKADGTNIDRTEGVSVSGNLTVIEITSNTLAVPGDIVCDVIFANNGETLGVANFEIKSLPGAIPQKDIKSQDDWQALVEATSAAEAAATQAESSATRAETAADEAESYTSHPNTILENDNWGIWDGTEYVDSGKSAKGQDGRVYEVHAGTGVNVDNSDPANPVVSATVSGAVESVVAGANIQVNDSDPAHPVISALSGAVWQDMEPAEGMTAAYAKFIRLTDSLALAVIDISANSGTFGNLQKLCSFPAGVNALPKTYQPCMYWQGANGTIGLVFPGRVPSNGSFGIHTNYGFTDKNRVIATLILELLQGETT